MEEHFFFLVFSIFFLFSFSFPFSSTWKPDLLCSTLLLHAHTSSIFSASSIPLPQRVSTTRHCHSCSFVVHALDLWLSAPPHVGSAYMVGLLFFFLFFFFFFFFFGYGDLQKWLQMVLWCHSDTGLVSSADESNPTSINTFLIDAILLQMCYCSRLIAEFRDMFVVRAHSLAINWHLGKPILLAYVPRIYRSCHLCDTNPLMLCFTALIWLY
jgi:hypothetical protein